MGLVERVFCTTVVLGMLYFSTSCSMLRDYLKNPNDGWKEISCKIKEFERFGRIYHHVTWTYGLDKDGDGKFDETKAEEKIYEFKDPSQENEWEKRWP